MKLFKKGDLLELSGKTLKGRNRINEHGNQWVITDIAHGHPFVHEGDLCIEPVEQKGRFPEGRWISRSNDPNFEIVGVRKSKVDKS